MPSFAVLPDGTEDLQGLGPLAPEFASTARAALAAQGNAAIAGSTSGGRAVWATTVPIPWPSPPTGRVLTRVRLVVDQASGLTSRMTLVFADGWRAEIEYSDLDAGRRRIAERLRHLRTLRRGRHPRRASFASSP